jgi:hypothetical protein
MKIILKVIGRPIVVIILCAVVALILKNIL